MGIEMRARTSPCEPFALKADHSEFVCDFVSGLDHLYDARIAVKGMLANSTTLFEIFSAENRLSLDNVPEKLREVTVLDDKGAMQTEVFRGDVPNAETLEAIKDVHEGKNLVGPFYTVKELMEYLHADD